jgi:hypothetical protein
MEDDLDTFDSGIESTETAIGLDEGVAESSIDEVNSEMDTVETPDDFAEPEAVSEGTELPAGEVTENISDVNGESIDDLSAMEDVSESSEELPESGADIPASGEELAEPGEEFSESLEDASEPEENVEPASEGTENPAEGTEPPVEEKEPVSDRAALDNMSEYMNAHNYGREDFGEYSRDPEYQRLNNELLESEGKDPIDYGSAESGEELPASDESVEPVSEATENPVEETEPPVEEGEPVSDRAALDNMSEYMNAHNYGREDFGEYSKDPEYQRLNNELLESEGKDPIDYGSAEPIEEPAEEVTENISDANGESIDDLSAMEDVSESSEELPESGTEIPASGEGVEPVSEATENPVEETEPPVEEGEPVSDRAALDNMSEYMNAHNYGREDFGEYSKDPEYQRLNNELLESEGKDPIDYGSAEPIEEPAEEVTENISDANGESIDDLSAMEDVSESSEELPESGTEIPASGESVEPVSETTENPVEETEPPVEEGEQPGNINEQSGSIFDDFTKSVVDANPEYGEMFESGVFDQQTINEYGYEGTCGETTQANTLNRLLDTNEYTENAVLNTAIDNGLCATEGDPSLCGGTTTDEFVELYDKMNENTGGQLNIERFEKDDDLSIDQMAERLDNGSVLNVAVDSSVLWDEDSSFGPRASDHWITVTGMERDDSGNISKVNIIDSGGGVREVDADKFNRCLYGTGLRRVTDPTCIVVSKKGQA